MAHWIVCTNETGVYGCFSGMETFCLSQHIRRRRAAQDEGARAPKASRLPVGRGPADRLKQRAAGTRTNSFVYQRRNRARACCERARTPD